MGIYMAAPKGNKFWKIRSKHGRSKLFANAGLLWDAACEYFEWVYSHPLKESKVCSFQGKNVLKSVPLMRAMTISGLCIYLGTHEEYLTSFESGLDLNTNEGKDFSRVIKDIRSVIITQKFEGASAGLLNQNIIARDLGLVDKKDVSGDILNPLTELINEISGNTLGPK
jgi:hypothetical protein